MRAIFGARRHGMDRRTIPLDKVDIDPGVEALGVWRPPPEIRGFSAAPRDVAMFAPAAEGAMAPRAVQRPHIFREPRSGLHRQLRPEISVRFDEHLDDAHIRRILRTFGLDVIQRNPLVENKLIASGAPLDDDPELAFDVAAQLSDYREVVFATPRFMSEYRRSDPPAISAEQWHLRNDGATPGQTRGEDVHVEAAWPVTLGAGVTVALLDDGVDVAHPSLASRLWSDPQGRRGRDFYVDPADPGHFDPRPKTWNHPFDRRESNDIHGTACAGIIAGNGAHGVSGVAPESTLLPLKIFHASRWADDPRIGSAIEFAALAAQADVLSCSWYCGRNDDIEDAILTAVRSGRGGRGCVVVCAVGNGDGASVEFPANMDGVIAVSASTDTGDLASYSNRGAEVALVAPSSGGVLRVFTADVSEPGRGFNPNGPTTDRFGGTSAAAAMVAGAAALVLAARPNLRAAEVREILMETADKIGDRPYVGGRNDYFGAGRVNLARALRRVRSFP